MDTQPAIKSYFFEKGYRDLQGTIQGSWRLNLAAAAGYMAKAGDCLDEDWGFLLAAGFFLAAASVVIFGTLFFLALSLIHIVILFSFFSVIYLGFASVRLFEELYMAKNRIFGACPACHEKFPLPVYLCPDCRVEHTCLIPSSYGILKRHCKCGAILPCTFFNGRRELEAACPGCQHGIEAAEATPICLPIVGGPGVGKTLFMYAASEQILGHWVAEKDWQSRFLNAQNERQYQQLKQRYERGEVFAKTVESTPRAFNFFLSSPRWSPDKLLYVYDAAGEAFQSADLLLEHRFYGYLHGLFFLIDPFCLPEVRVDYAAQLAHAPESLQTSTESLEDIFDRLLLHIESQFQIARTAKVTQPCALILNKVDVFDLEARFGSEAVRAQVASSAEDPEQVQDTLCRDFLVYYGYQHILEKLEHKFKSYRFFACSSTGHLPDGRPFQPVGIEAPVRWVLSRADRHLKQVL